MLFVCFVLPSFLSSSLRRALARYLSSKEEERGREGQEQEEKRRKVRREVRSKKKCICAVQKTIKRPKKQTKKLVVWDT